jgi:valyl-tRNA synthetase
MNDAIDAVYQMIWGSFCDWGLETAKSILQGNDEAAKERTLSVLLFVLDGVLRLASPFIPFVTEEIWQKLPQHPSWDRPEALVVAKFPEAAELPRFAEDAARWQKVQDLVSGIRSVRSQASVPPKQQLDAYVRTDADTATLFKKSAADIMRLAGLSKLEAASDLKRPGQCLAAVGKGFEAYVPAAGLLDVAKEKTRLESEIARIGKIVTGIDQKLSNPSFADRAPADVVAATKEQRANMQSMLDSLKVNLAALS